MGGAADANAENRFRQRNELMYSLRSVEKFAPFVRKIHVVVADGQVPAFLNISHPKIELVQHSQIFKDPSNLPTFNSLAIEANLLNIPGLSDYFLYFNDDIFLGHNVTPNDLLVSKFTGQQKPYMEPRSWNQEWAIHTNCPSQKMGNGRCDQECLTASYGWDQGDCGLNVITEGLAELERNRRNRTFHPKYDGFVEGVRHSDGMLNRAGFRPPVHGRRVVKHVPHFINKRMAGDFKSRFAQDHKWTEEHTFRHPEDIILAFAYNHYLEAVRVYAPTKKMAWRAAFRSIEGKQTFLYERKIEERIEKARALSIRQNDVYAQVKSCAEHLLKHRAPLELDLLACDQAMECLIHEQDLRLPYGASFGGDSRQSLFVMIGDNEKKALKDLSKVQMSSHKFITINDDMMVEHPIVEQAYLKTMQTLFPHASAFENL